MPTTAAELIKTWLERARRYAHRDLSPAEREAAHRWRMTELADLRDQDQYAEYAIALDMLQNWPW